ncbi:hypothetical protein BvCmsL112A_00012 [Escherichia coli]|nr:hypothetical protein BvCmsL112A_00012 [Escherichia coli]GDL62019.1 hypothetical protein BvCmsKSNP101_01431 [Escherichia coli]GDU28455.1 hypothetical protein BvCmsSINP009_04404 [Escherichia coli]
MSLLNDVQKFIEAHPGCTSGDIADAFAGYSRQRVLQSASKLRQSGRVAHRCEGDTRRHFPRLTERAQEPEPQPVRETRPVRNFYVGTTVAFEEKYGSQLELIFRFIDRALAIGVLA